MRPVKLWPHLTLFALLFAVLGGVGAALWVRHEQNVEAEELQSAARIERIDGQVGINNSLVGEPESSWIQATPNMPVSVGDRIYTRNNSRAAIAFTGRNFARLNDGSALDVISLSDRRTQLALRDGSALFDVGYLQPGDLFEVATPYGAVDLNQPGLYEVGINNDGSSWISVLSGLAQVVGLAGSGQINKGEMLTLLGQTAADIALSRLDPTYAGGLANDYYSYRYPYLYDGRYQDYNAYLSDPYYYDPYRRYTSYQYASDEIPGLYDLDYYGDWQDVNGYGYAWRPRVDQGWAPYQSGYWTNDYPYGLTWVSNEPWGYAPYHYGRWAYVNNQWFWVPERVRTDPIYSPAMVAFLPFNGSDVVGWVPLAPGDAYVPRYYDENWRPHYYNRGDLTPQQVVNLHVPGAVTIVPWEDFHNDIDRRRIRRGDRELLATTRPVLDPLMDGPLRNAVLHSAWGRGKIDLPPGIARKLDETRVVSGSGVPAFPFRRDLAKRLRVESVPENAKSARMQFRDERKTERRRDDVRWPAETNARESERRNPNERVQQEQLRRDRDRQSVQQAQGERVAAMRAERMRAEREQRGGIHRQQAARAEQQRQWLERGAAGRVQQQQGRKQEQRVKEAPRQRYVAPSVPVQPREQRQVVPSHERRQTNRGAEQQSPRQNQSIDQKRARPVEVRPDHQQKSGGQPQKERGNGKGRGRP